MSAVSKMLGVMIADAAVELGGLSTLTVGSTGS